MLKASFSEGFSGTFAIKISAPLFFLCQICKCILSLCIGKPTGWISLQLYVGEWFPSTAGVVDINPSTLNDTKALQSLSEVASGNPSHFRILTARLYPVFYRSGLLSINIPFFFSCNSFFAWSVICFQSSLLIISSSKSKSSSFLWAGGFSPGPMMKEEKQI